MAIPPDPALTPPPLDDEDPDLGPPVLELQVLRAPPTPGFHRRLTRRIERRRVAADLTTLGVTGPLTAVVEVLAGLLKPALPTPRRAGSRDRMARRHDTSAPPRPEDSEPKNGAEAGPRQGE